MRHGRCHFHLGGRHEIPQGPQLHGREAVCLLVMLRQKTKSFSSGRSKAEDIRVINRKFSEMSIFGNLRKEWTNKINMNAVDDYKYGTNQKDLAAGILKQAAQDLRRFHGATSAVERELYLDAHRWVVSDNCSWPFSFLNVCQLLNVEAESLRRELLTDAPLGLFGYLARRCGRAARSFQVFLNRVVTTDRNTAVDPVPLTRVPIT